MLIETPGRETPLKVYSNLSTWIWSVSFCEGRRTRELGEKPLEQDKNQQQTQPTYDTILAMQARINPGPHWWDGSQHLSLCHLRWKRKIKEGKKDERNQGKVEILFNTLTWQLKQVWKSTHPSWENLPRLCFCGKPRPFYQLSYNFPTCVSAKHLTTETNSTLHFKQPWIQNNDKNKHILIIY